MDCKEEFVVLLKALNQKIDFLISRSPNHLKNGDLHNEALIKYSAALGCTPDVIISYNRTRDIHDRRMAIIYILYTYEGYTISQISRIINRDHSSIIGSIKQHHNIYEYSEQYKKMIDDLKSKYNLK